MSSTGTQTALKATALQQVFELLAMLLSLVLVPLYLARLGQEGYGLFLTGVAWASYLMFSNGGLSAATLILVSQAHGLKNHEEVARVFRNARALTALGSALVIAFSWSLFLLLRVPSVAAALKLTHPDAPLLALLVGAQVAASLITSPFYDLLIGIQQAQVVALIQGAVRLLTQLLTVAFLLAHFPVWGVFAASPICIAVGGINASIVVARRHRDVLRAGPWLERSQAVAQLRTGAKSLGLQIGNTLVGTAPIFALQAVGGPALVPFYAVPNRIISVVTGALFSFTALMQPAVGEAWARRDLPWLRSSAVSVLRSAVVLLVGVGVVVAAIGPAFVATWTLGKLEVTRTMVAGLAAAALALGLVSAMKFMLSGMNRHRVAAGSELANGAMTMLLCWSLAKLSFDTVAFGVAIGALCTSLWLMPRELRRYLEADRVLPRLTELLLIAAFGGAVFGIGAGLWWWASGLPIPKLLSLAVIGSLSAAVYAGLCQVSGLFDVIGPLGRLYRRFRPAPPSAEWTAAPEQSVAPSSDESGRTY